MKYCLLYYDWKWSEELEEVCAQLLYCANLGELDDASVETFARTHRINHYDQSGVWYTLRGFSPSFLCDDSEIPDECFYESFYEIRAHQSINEVLKILCAEAMVRFEDAKNSPHDDAVSDMLEIIRQASIISTGNNEN